MLQGAQQASVPSTAGPRPNTANSATIPHSDQSPRDGAVREGCRGGTGAEESLVRASVVAPRVSCGICGGLLHDATAFTECLHAFCRKCIYDKVAKDNIECCPKCGIFLGNPLEKLRSLIFPAKRRKVFTMKKRKERVSSESTLSSVVGITAEGSAALTPATSESKAQKDRPLVERDALSGTKGRDFDSACGLTEETGALVVWQASPILEEMVAHNQLDSKQGPESFRLPATSDIENQRQGPTAQMTNISFMVESSSSARPTVQDDENLRGDFLTLINENNARIMGRYDAHISKLKAENTKSIEELENERERTRVLEERLQQELENERTAAAERTRLLEKLQRELEHEREAAIERTRILEERLQRELGNERAAAAERTGLLEKKLQRVEHEREAAMERTRVLDKRLQRESEIAQTTASRNEALEKKIFKLQEELEHGRADNQALMSDILEKSEELATLKYYSNMLESEKTHLENQVDHLDKELKYTRKEHRRYVSKVLDAAKAIPNDLEPINSAALPGSRCTSGIC
ncbi:E3 ubiquitin protein ligase DRIP1 isoform X2 [Sorghum bicolor]|uniref:RING-type domain-containing protein n=2 Tax=Sorghum bicolor TaxID=4558 RepID=A0A1B6Q9D8_SORBI|nr:E3 ubiquitin protein ligase DRIP1 isoform X2 [Sorghum bicolor]KXG34543.1 hypothetical protein SORBI_3002G055800 [Sorghum bicolor]|eukprot:XP_021308605.1 E3 ubiquitin protein ligase DRIP1 isoform X2 [Sorghum bicolor]